MMIFGPVAQWNYEQEKRIRANQGGTYSGKTYGIDQVLLLKSLEDEERKITSVVAESVPHLKRGALRDFINILTDLGLYETRIRHNKTDNTFEIGKSLIEFFSADNPAKVRGGKRNRLFVNEANRLSWETFSQLDMRTTEEVYLDWNPVGEFWFHEKLQGREDVAFNISTYENNPVITKQDIQRIERLKDIDPELYRIYGLGLTGKILGLIFEAHRCSRFPEGAKRIAYGLDFGFTNDPTALVKCGELHGEFFGRELIYETGLTNPDIVRRMKDIGVGRTEEIYADAAEPKSIEEIRRMGFNIKAAPKGPGSVSYGIDTLKARKINITTDSVNWLKEAGNYKWKEKDGKSLNVPIDEFNHCWDAARYYAASKLSKPKTGWSYAKPAAAR